MGSARVKPPSRNGSGKSVYCFAIVSARRYGLKRAVYNTEMRRVALHTHTHTQTHTHTSDERYWVTQYTLYSFLKRDSCASPVVPARPSSCFGAKAHVRAANEA